MKTNLINALGKAGLVLALSVTPAGVPAASHVIAWGYPGWTNVPPGLTNAVAVAANLAGDLTLKADGTMTAWAADGWFFTNAPPEGLSNIVAITSGSEHSLALKGDGTVAVWGSYTVSSAAAGYFMPVDYWVPQELTNVVAIAGGDSCSLALKGDGSVLAWGVDNGVTGVSLPPGLTNVVMIAAGYNTDAALKADGTLVVWPVSESASASLSVQVTNVTALAAGFLSAVVLQADGTALRFDADFELGSLTLSDVVSNVVEIGADLDDGGSLVYLMSDGSISPEFSDQMPPTLPNAVAASVAFFHGLVLIADGPPLVMKPADRTIALGGTSLLRATAVGAPPLSYQWQFNEAILPGATNAALRLDDVQFAQSGVYTLVVSNAFGQATSSAAVVSIAPLLITAQPKSQATFRGATVEFEVAAAGPGPIEYQWHFNGKDIDQATKATLVLANVQPAQSGAYSVTVRNGLASVQSADATLEVGPVAAWGSYYSGHSLPFGLTNVVAISAGGPSSSAALSSDGSILLWGGPAGQLGLTTPSGLSNVVAIAAVGGDLQGGVLALRRDGTVVLWTPAATLTVPGLTNAVAIAGGGVDLALRADGTVSAFLGWDGQTNAIVPPASPLAPPLDLSNVVVIAAGGEHGLALSRQGTVLAWGGNQFGETNVPPALSNVVSIAAGYGSSLALKADGTVVAWGSLTGVPPGLTNAVAIATGDSYGLALKSDGTIVAWGIGATNVPRGLTNVVAIAADWVHGLALIGEAPPALHAAAIVPRWESDHFACVVPTECGRVYQLEFKDSLSEPDWKALPLVAGDGGLRTLTDATASSSQRFYRVRRW